jgi:hypothetical protein
MALATLFLALWLLDDTLIGCLMSALALFHRWKEDRCTNRTNALLSRRTSSRIVLAAASSCSGALAVVAVIDLADTAGVGKGNGLRLEEVELSKNFWHG